MPFLGTIINFLCVAVFSLLGAGLKKIIPQRASKAILSAVGVCIIYMGIDGALEPAEGHLTTFFGDAGVTKFIIIVISLVLGTAIGEAINLDKHIGALGEKIESRISKGEGNGDFARGFVAVTLTTCVGAMAVFGSILDAAGDPSTLIAKSVLDAISCTIMAASFGVGCAFAAIPILVYQGSITALTLLVQTALADSPVFNSAIYYMSSSGSLILVLIGLNFLGATNVKTANMTPAVFIPLIMTPILALF